jgi:hypothetical protein
MFQILTQFGDRNLAVKHALKLENIYSGAHDFANQNPCSTVYKLVSELFSLEHLLKNDEKG